MFFKFSTTTITKVKKIPFVNRFVPNNTSTPNFSLKCHFLVKPTVKKSSAISLQEYRIFAYNSGQIYLKHITLKIMIRIMIT